MAHKFTRQLQELIVQIKANGLYDISSNDAEEMRRLFEVGTALTELLGHQSCWKSRHAFPGIESTLKHCYHTRVLALRTNLQDGLKP